MIMERERKLELACSGGGDFLANGNDIARLNPEQKFAKERKAQTAVGLEDDLFRIRLQDQPIAAGQHPAAFGGSVMNVRIQLPQVVFCLKSAEKIV